MCVCARVHVGICACVALWTVSLCFCSSGDIPYVLPANCSGSLFSSLESVLTPALSSPTKGGDNLSPFITCRE